MDTNVIVSALVFGGLPRQVLELATEGVCALYFSAPIQAEVEEVNLTPARFHGDWNYTVAPSTSRRRQR